MSEEPTEQDVEALAAETHAQSIHRLGTSEPCGICAHHARAVLASYWYAEHIAQARREGAVEALDEAAADVLLDDSAGDYGTHVWLKSRAAHLRGDA